MILLLWKDGGFENVFNAFLLGSTTNFVSATLPSRTERLRKFIEGLLPPQEWLDPTRAEQAIRDAKSAAARAKPGPAWTLPEKAHIARRLILAAGGVVAPTNKNGGWTPNPESIAEAAASGALDGGPTDAIKIAAWAGWDDTAISDHPEAWRRTSTLGKSAVAHVVVRVIMSGIFTLIVSRIAKVSGAPSAWHTASYLLSFISRQFTNSVVGDSLNSLARVLAEKIHLIQ